MPDSEQPQRGDSPAAPGVSSQLRFFQFTSGLLALLLLAGAGYYVYRQHAVQPVAIEVNGQPVATLENTTAAKAILSAAYAALAGPAFSAQGEPEVVEHVTLAGMPQSAPIDTDDTAQRKLSAAIHMTVEADAIVVNGRPLVALPDKDTAQKAVDLLRAHYVDLSGPGQLSEKPGFQENVQIERKRLPLKLTCTDPDDAAQRLWTPPPARLYTVQPHQTGWAIARKEHMQFAAFLRANAGKDINRLKPGDQVNVNQTFPPVTVIVKKVQLVDESFGGTGERRMTEVFTYMNGAQIGAPEAIDFQTVQRATLRRRID